MAGPSGATTKLEPYGFGIVWLDITLPDRGAVPQGVKHRLTAAPRGDGDQRFSVVVVALVLVGGSEMRAVLVIQLRREVDREALRDPEASVDRQCCAPVGTDDGDPA